MRLDLIPDTPAEADALADGSVPVVIHHTLTAAALAQSVVIAVQAGIFSHLHAGAASAEEIAAAAGLDPRATRQLLRVLASSGYLVRNNDSFDLSDIPRQWLSDEGANLTAVLSSMTILEFKWLRQLRGFITSGQPLALHDELTDTEWGAYQRDMRAYAELTADEIVDAVELVDSPRRMLDLGGSHGYQSVAFCRRYPSLTSIVIDLPEALVHAAPLLQSEGLGERILQRSGDVRDAELGVGEFDLVYSGNLLHHFDETTCRELFSRAAAALAPGGVLTIYDTVSAPEAPEDLDQITELEELIYSLISAGTWHIDDMERWLNEAGLDPLPAVEIGEMKARGAVVVMGRKPGGKR